MKKPATHRRRTMALALSIVALTLTFVAGCGTDDAKNSTSTAGHNPADVTFATNMIQHHAQALAMVNLTVERPLDPRFRALASRIRDAQAPEIEAMTKWLGDWDESVPATANDRMDHDMSTMSEGTADMPGMMSADEMSQLEAAADGAFQRLWLEMMVRHHEGAVEMAKAEKAAGKFMPALDLAASIITSQTTEIDEMKALLATL